MANYWMITGVNVIRIVVDVNSKILLISIYVCMRVTIFLEELIIKYLSEHSILLYSILLEGLRSFVRSLCPF